MSTRIAIVGAHGRMGRFASELVERTNGLALVARITSDVDLAASLRTAQPDVALDVTRAGLGYGHALQMLELGIRPLIGTSGVSIQENNELDEVARARGIGGLVVPNFSLGMCLLQRAALDAATRFERCEIIEMHHEKKRDAPSGTALDTVERMRAVREPSASDIPIHSVRLPGSYAHQLVIFGAAGETYTLRHDMSGPEGFGDGIVLALRYAARARGVGRGLGVALDDAARRAPRS